MSQKSDLGREGKVKAPLESEDEIERSAAVNREKGEAP